MDKTINLLKNDNFQDKILRNLLLNSVKCNNMEVSRWRNKTNHNIKINDLSKYTTTKIKGKDNKIITAIKEKYNTNLVKDKNLEITIDVKLLSQDDIGSILNKSYFKGINLKLTEEEYYFIHYMDNGRGINEKEYKENIIRMGQVNQGLYDINTYVTLHDGVCSINNKHKEKEIKINNKLYKDCTGYDAYILIPKKYI